MPGSVRVHIHDDGCATVQESSGELHFDQASLVRAAYKAKECCELRKVYYPIGSEHCPCLGADVGMVAVQQRASRASRRTTN